MKIPIRMISIATTFFWIFLIVFFVLAVYSVKDVRFDFGEPKISLTSENNLLFSLPILIDNRGYHNIGSFNATTVILDDTGSVITHGCTFIPIIEKDRQVRANHTATIDMDRLLQDYLFNDTELRVHAMVGMELAEVIPVQASTNLSTPWGAPFYNFTLGQVVYAAGNMTHLTVTIPLTFENHAFFDIIGNIQIHMYNSNSALLSEGQTIIEVSQNVIYQGQMELDVPVGGMTENGYFEVYFSTPAFHFGPLVIPYG